MMSFHVMDAFQKRGGDDGEEKLIIYFDGKFKIQNCRRNDGRVRRLTVSPSQFELCPEP